MRERLCAFMGSKLKLVPLLVKRFPREYRRMRWVDVFGGMGTVTYKKPRSVQEIYNDYDEGISAIFWHLATDYDRFAAAVSDLIYSVSMYKWFKELNPETMNRFDKALRTLYLTHLAFSGGFGNSLIGVPERPCNRHIIWDEIIWEKWRKRFAGVFIKNMDFQELIEKYDSYNTFFYCDPPYTVARGTGYYNVIFEAKDHTRLFDVLCNIKGKCLVSYDNNPIIKKQYEDAGFNVETIYIRYQARKMNKTDSKELLISNYKIKTLEDFL